MRTLTGLRQIGTSYMGKESHEHVVDVLRTLVRRAGVELGFESCLTSRPFTSRTFVSDRLGTMIPGRSGAVDADRAGLDLMDALLVLSEWGWQSTEGEFTSDRPVSGAGQVVVAGPLKVDDRWCPTADRIAFGAAWRHVVIEHWIGSNAICLDPVFGGYSSLPADSLRTTEATLQIIRVPDRLPNVGALANRCLRVGAAVRASEAAVPVGGRDRDGSGFLQCADRTSDLVTGGPSHRLQLALRNHALHAFRWSGLLGHVGPLGTDSLVLADVLAEIVVGCRDSHAALLSRDAMSLERELRRIADLANGVTELAARIAAGSM